MPSVSMAVLTAILLQACYSNAQFEGIGGFNPQAGPGNSHPGSSYPGSSSSDGFSNGHIEGPQHGEEIFGRTKVVTHGVLACLAMVIFFPFGAISIRLIPSKAAFYLHLFFQILGYILFTIAFGLGVWMARQVTFASFKLMSQYHPVIGIIVFSFLSLQPILGVLHHVFFRKYNKRTVWSFAHVWLGRLVVLLGVINGGLGLRLADNASVGAEVAYGVIAGLIWCAWVAAAIVDEVKRFRTRTAPSGYREPLTDGASKDKDGGVRAIYA